MWDCLAKNEKWSSIKNKVLKHCTAMMVQRYGSRLNTSYSFINYITHNASSVQSETEAWWRCSDYKCAVGLQWCHTCFMTTLVCFFTLYSRQREHESVSQGNVCVVYSTKTSALRQLVLVGKKKLKEVHFQRPLNHSGLLKWQWVVVNSECISSTASFSGLRKN